MQFDEDERFCPAIMMIEIDSYKHISEVLGYQLGDELIVRFSEKLRAILGSEAFISRYSESRLAVILPYFYDKVELTGRIHKVLELSDNTIQVNSYGLDIGMHIGISISSGRNQQLDIIVQQAEMALYLAKSAGNSQYRFYSEELDISAYKQFKLRNDLKQSIENNQLQVHFQPIVSLKANEIIAAEALIRWQHPSWGMVPPGEFIALAEETGFIIDIGRWVLREVCCLYKQWLDRGLPAIKVSINFSSIQFFEVNFVENIINTIYDFGLDPSFLVMEITESTLLDNMEKARLEIKRLKAYGIKIALDDFGTGFSSLAYLHSFDIDIIKIDGAFIRNSLKDTTSEVISRSIINMAWELKLHLVAEGIETHQQLIYLQKLNCYAGQGYLFSKPLSVHDFERILSQGVCNPITWIERHSRKEERRSFDRISFPGLPEADMAILKLNNKKVNVGNTKVLIKNISPGGLCFLTNVRMPVEKEVLLQFGAQLNGIRFNVVGNAVWINILESGIYEYGVKFVIDDCEQLELLAILNQVGKEIKREALVAEEIPISELYQIYKRRVTEVIYSEKK
jgi:diguanylate cyclase (GGDEF)-like protein